ncbi:Receptor-like protein 4 [Cardamine amara subsp. amara]|uniref:Receptor-like protein 4 n=1 Tax=Cardamine amara subsp. amara TaxID=228776 RepID=A0ABD1AHX9_CARAN
MPSFFFLFLSSFFLLLLPISISSPFNTSFFIDCGSPEASTDVFNRTWLPDRFYSGGSTAVVSEPLRFHLIAEKTIRYFPLSFGKKNCYVVPLPIGRYYIRTFTVYDNYDGKSHSPSFDVSVEGTLVFSWRSPWPESLLRDGSYSDLFAFIGDGELDLCFYSIATDPPIVGSLEVSQVDPSSYDADGTGQNVLLVNYGRLSCGSDQWGPGFTNHTDYFGRSWQSDEEFRSDDSKLVARSLSTVEKIKGVDQPPNYFPMKLYQSAVTVSGVKKAGQRVFDLVVNEKNVSRVDVFNEVGGFAAFSLNYTVKNLSSTTVKVKLSPVTGAPIISGLENYAIVPADMATVPEQMTAMKALKDSLRVPDRMGWNGDPCAPTSWNAWEGVACRTNPQGSALVIFQIDLGSQGLKGFISEQISLLTDLNSLNLSSNSLSGSLPSGLGHKSLVSLDLSNNLLTGPIPESLTTSSLKLVLLNGNELQGQVPEEVYSVGVHGGIIDLSGNKGLCGVPSLPSCPLLWENGHLSKGGKLAIAVSCVVVFVLVLLAIYLCCIWRGRHDYDFAPPHDLTSLAAKRNRYQRQKSLMLLEMESQHAKGMPTLPLNSQ